MTNNALHRTAKSGACPASPAFRRFRLPLSLVVR